MKGEVCHAMINLPCGPTLEGVCVWGGVSVFLKAWARKQHGGHRGREKGHRTPQCSCKPTGEWLDYGQRDRYAVPLCCPCLCLVAQINTVTDTHTPSYRQAHSQTHSDTQTHTQLQIHSQTHSLTCTLRVTNTVTDTHSHT